MILAQQTYGKGDKIRFALKHGCVDGAILSPNFINPSNVQDEIQSITDLGGIVIFDTMFCYGFDDFEKADNTKYIDQYPYFINYTKDFDVFDIPGIIESTIQYQIEIGLNTITLPNVFTNFVDHHTSTLYFKQFCKKGNEIIQKSKYKQYKFNLTINLKDEVLNDEEKVDDILNLLTSYENIHGFNIIVHHGSRNQGHVISSSGLARLMKIVYYLTRKGKEVHYLYSNTEGLLLLAVGAKSMTCGWSSKGDRFFSDNLVRQKERNGGRVPTKKYYSKGLLHKLKINNELSFISKNKELMDRVLSGTEFDNLVIDIINDQKSKNESEYKSEIEFAIKCKIFKEISDEFSVLDMGERIDLLNRKLKSADALIYDISQFNSSDGLIDRSVLNNIESQNRRFLTAISEFNEYL